MPNENWRLVMESIAITISETGESDLENVLALWNDGDVMKYVGFPNGVGETMEGMIRWLSRIEKNKPLIRHYCVYADDKSFCGETFYKIDPDHDYMASLDIKLFSTARGKGIASRALSYTITKAFDNGAQKVWVDPNPANSKALALYERLGFIAKDMPDYLRETEMSDVDFSPVYMEIDKEHWYARQ